jgi:hypothetical protein
VFDRLRITIWHARPRDAPLGRRLIVLLACVYCFSSKGYLQVVDTAPSLKTAEALLTHGSLAIEQVGGTLRGPDGRYFSKYGIGLPLVLLPYVVAGRSVAALTGLPAADLVGFVASFVSVPFALLSVVMFARLIAVFGGSARDRWLLSAALGFGTLCWAYATSDFSEAIQMAFLLLAVYGVVRATPRSIAAAGAGFAALMVVKLVHVALLPFFIAYLLALPSPAPRRRFLAFFATPVVLAIGLLAWLNVARFGNPLESGYGAEAHQFFLSQLPATIPQLLFSLDKGLFVFSPVVVLGLLGWRPFIGQRRRDALLFAAIIIVELALAGAWHSWGGGWSWGPRLLVPTIPLWLAPAAFWLKGARTARRFQIAALITVLSVVVQIPGVLVKDQEIHEIKSNMLTPEERASVTSDFLAAPVLLLHKLRSREEVYGVTDLGVPGDRMLDLRSYSTFRGVNVFTEHLARQFHRPMIRWLPLATLLAMVG